MAILRIELLEDCDLHSGRVVNTYFTDDVFFDGFGLPFIPAWIIRNSFMMAIEDARGEFSDEEKEALAGVHARLILDDALIADRESMRQAIRSNEYGGALLRNPQAVLNASGFTKVQASSNMVRGKYMRVLAQGVIFEAYFELDERYRDAFRRLISRMGALFVGHKTRARFTMDESWERPPFDSDAPQVNFEGQWCRLEYDLHILSHTTALDHVTGEMAAHPFITGREIRRALVRREELSGLFSTRRDELRCSYAYIEVDGRRGLPIPASYSTKKQDKNDLRDRCSQGRRIDDFDQISGTGDLFIDDSDSEHVHAMSVRMEQAIVQYYKDGSWQSCNYLAIGQGQTFKGFIEGPAADVKRIYDSLEANGFVRLGHLSNLGFGNAAMQVRSVAPIGASSREPVLVREITVLLASPARLYNAGLYEPTAQNVLEQIQSKLGGVALKIVRNSQKTCCISNYNTMWKELEPIEYGMQAGSAYRMRSVDDEPFDISAVLGGIFIGGHIADGYGEALVLPAVDRYYRTIDYDNQSEGDFSPTYKVDPNPGRRLMRLLYQKNANLLASYMGGMAAEEYVLKSFRDRTLQEIHSTICDDLDTVQIFEAFIDTLKKEGLDIIRGGRCD